MFLLSIYPWRLKNKLKWHFVYWTFIGHYNRQFGIEIQEFCTYQGFPGGSVVKNLPAKARQHGFDPWSRKIPHASGKLSLLSPRSRAWGLQWLSPHAKTTELCTPWIPCSKTKEVPLMRSPSTTTREQPPLLMQIKEKPTHQWRPSTAKINKWINNF